MVHFVIESIFSSMKRKEVYRTKYRSELDLRNAADKILYSATASTHTIQGSRTKERRICIESYGFIRHVQMDNLKGSDFNGVLLIFVVLTKIYLQNKK